MPQPSPSRRKDILTGAILFAPVFVLGTVSLAVVWYLVWLPIKPAVDVLEQLGEARQSMRPERVFSVDEIDGISDVYNAVRLGASPGVRSTGQVHAAILPHHTLAGSELMDLWTEIALGNPDPSVIVIIGPNHENAGEAQAQTTRGRWTSPFGSVRADTELVQSLVDSGAAAEEPDSFVNEHAIGTHVPYLAALYPEVPILPVIAKSTADPVEAERFVSSLERVLPDDALVIASIDFSHYLPRDATAEMDEETLDAIDRRAFDEIGRMKSDHLDTPFSLIAYFLWSERLVIEPEFVWHGFSHDLMGNPMGPGTSYLVYLTQSFVERPIVLTAAGDVMLGRAVEGKLAQTTIESAFSGAREVFAGSDLAFINLESILSSTSIQSGKELHFKADPERIDVLQFLGITHASVSNNHVNDYGELAWEESLGHLSDGGILPIGSYRNDGPPVVTEVNGQTFVFLAFEDLNRPLDPTSFVSQIEKADALGDTLIVSVHWGVEYVHEPNARQIDLAHAAVDAGAEVVLGHHPHVLQGIETYKDSLILYSLGNFIFDQYGEDQNESVVATLTWDGDTRTLALVPMRIDGYLPRRTTHEEYTETLERIASWSFGEAKEDLLDGLINW